MQCGLGRTGRPFYSGALGLKPDLMAVGKSLGAGVPVAAALFTRRSRDAAAFGDHGSTYGGNLLACRAALVFLDELTQDGLMEHVARVGAPCRSSRCGPWRRGSPAVKDVRGAGLIWGIDLDRPAAPVVEAALDRGLLDQPHVGHRDPPAAAVRDHGRRIRRRGRASGSGDRRVARTPEEPGMNVTFRQAHGARRGAPSTT